MTDTEVLVYAIITIFACAYILMDAYKDRSIHE